MKISYLKIECLFLSVLVGLTFGVVLSVFVGVSVFVKTLVTFPIELYNVRMQSHLRKRLEALSEVPDDIWGRHIERMEKNKTKKNEEL
jgi:hypothetical protein|tara:strand:- start:144 stop:407 length:264 start_codon:yes stop_codon:yes gene_type:complete